jgi:hypothetical protein
MPPELAKTPLARLNVACTASATEARLETPAISSIESKQYT